MKTLSVLVMGLMTWPCFAGQVLQTVQDPVSYSKISTNFDGSVYMEEPKVFVAGTYIALISSESGTGRGTAIGFCQILGRKFVSTGVPTGDTPQTVALNPDGTFLDLYAVGSYYSVPWIVCR